MHKFDYTFLRNVAIPSDILDLYLGVSNGRTWINFFKKDYPKVFTYLIEIAKIQSVKASNEIEGIVTTDKRMKEIIEERTEPLNHNEKEIAGYRDALHLIHNNHDKIKINEEDFLNLHNILLSYTDKEFKGKYKNIDNVILESDKSCNKKIRFKPISVEETPKAMEQLILAFIDAFSDSSINKLLLIPCFILDFLCIHPFQDGNGRMSRLITILLLYKINDNICKYISFENIINKYKSSYYEHLEKSSKNWNENKNDYWPFITNFLFTLNLCYEELNKRYEIVKERKLNKTKIIEETIKKSFLSISKNEIHLMWPNISIGTIEAVLSELLKSDFIKKDGTTNGCKYIWKK